MRINDTLDGVTSSEESEEDSKSNLRTANEVADADGKIEREESGGVNGCANDLVDEPVADISGQNLEFGLLEKADETLHGLYVYRNIFNLIPKSVGRFGRLRKLKFFGNEIDVFPAELANLENLEFLQVKLSSPDFSNGLSLNKLKHLKELELTKVPRQSSVLAVLSEISGLGRLNKLSVCYFSIRYLPPEIGCLKSLEFLELSFNKLKTLPKEISYLSSLISLKIAHNKLVTLPSSLTSLQKLEIMDLSNNRLTSLESLDLYLMHSLQNLNLQYNQLWRYCRIPSWISCNMEGNGKYFINDDVIGSPVEMDIYETSFQDSAESMCAKGSCRGHICLSNGHSSHIQSCLVRRTNKRWKRRQDYFQHKARQERLNNSRKLKGEGMDEGLSLKLDEHCRWRNNGMTASVCLKESVANTVGLDDGDDDDRLLPVEVESENSVITSEGNKSSEGCAPADFESANTKEQRDFGRHVMSSATVIHEGTGVDYNLSLNGCEDTKITSNKTKRQCDSDLENPKACKFQRPAGDIDVLSRKYSINSFLRSEEVLPDGFYDAGRDRPFMPLRRYEQNLNLDSREVILVDRGKDEELDAITSSARNLISRLKRLNGLAKGGREQGFLANLHIASLLALFVSDHFGGSDRSSIVERIRKNASCSNYCKPFVCTCSTGNSKIDVSTKQVLDVAGDVNFTEICEKSLHSIKLKRNSMVIPIGDLQFGVCRHRSLLMKYLCDRMDPPIPCELVRGYLDFLPHSWNVIPVKKGNSWVRMIVDACHPHEIKEESDPEYFCRYIPLCRVDDPATTKIDLDTEASYPSLSSCDEIEKAGSSSLVLCKLGSIEVVAKVRKLDVSGASAEEVRNFEYSCLGEVRILSVLEHPCIIKMYGHQISHKWLASADGNEDRRVVQSSVLMEHIRGGSLKRHLEKLAQAGDKRMPMDLALKVARDIASALDELHSKHIIHRDIKSENILIDMTTEGIEGVPVVKLCDFDRAVPLRSFLHTCCIGHGGIHPPDVCVGTPRWMAPEVMRAMHQRCLYGLEVDIWSYGCLIYELLTLQVPYSELSELQLHDAIQSGRRPCLPDDLDAIRCQDELRKGHYVAGLDIPKADLETLKFLIDLFYRCTEVTPSDRPTTGDIKEMLLAHNDSRLRSSVLS